MVFENLTLFEVNLENSRFSARRGESGAEEAESYDGESEEVAPEEEASGGRSKALPIGVVLFLVVGALAFRRFRSGGDVESADETDGITIEQAAEQ